MCNQCFIFTLDFVIRATRAEQMFTSLNTG